MDNGQWTLDIGHWTLDIAAIAESAGSGYSWEGRAGDDRNFSIKFDNLLHSAPTDVRRTKPSTDPKRDGERNT
ncbi:hypothetical protein H4I96_07168 [Botrytis cinerea]